MAPHPKEGDQLVKAYHNKDASVCHNKDQKLMVKLSAPVTDKGNTASVDVVFVLDISGSMKGDKLEDMKRAMRDFIFEKLGNGDGLAIIPFSSTAADKVNQFRAVTLTAKEREKAAKFVGDLEAGGNTNIEAGLRAGLNYLDKERLPSRRDNASCIFLMSDGHENVGKASNLHGDVADHSVVTFGFGENSDEQLLYGIASNSHAGTYQHVREREDQNKLMTAFAAQLGIYRSISMLRVKVTLTAKAGCKILRADAGTYKKEGSTDKGFFKISFGDLARHENRRILVDLELPKVGQEQKEVTVMQVEYEYSEPKMKGQFQRQKKAAGIDIKMNRVKNAPCEAPTDPNVTRELVRRGQVKHLYQVMQLADNKNMGSAKEEVDDAINELGPISQDGDEALNALDNELSNLEEFLDNYDVYNKLGRAYLLACISSHERQRFASRGGAMPVDLFRTPRMDKYLDQARKAHKNRKP